MSWAQDAPSPLLSDVNSWDSDEENPASLEDPVDKAHEAELSK